jgi:hypothetical protein
VQTLARIGYNAVGAWRPAAWPRPRPFLVEESLMFEGFVVAWPKVGSGARPSRRGLRA